MHSYTHSDQAFLDKRQVDVPVFAGTFYSFALDKNSIKLKLGVNLGFERDNARSEFVEAADDDSGQTVRTYKGTMARFFLAPSLRFDLGPKAKNLFVQLQYGRAVYVFRGDGSDRSEHFAQFSPGMRFRVF